MEATMTTEKPITKKQAKINERSAAIERLHEILKPGDTVYCILRHRAASGMSRRISFCVHLPEGIVEIDWLVARALDYKIHNKGGLQVGGCGMDMGFHMVYNLARTMFPEGFKCIGKDCPSNDHNNAWGTSKQDLCIVCRKQLPQGSEWTRRNTPTASHAYTVCSEACAIGPWTHSDGGYALKSRWL